MTARRSPAWASAALVSLAGLLLVGPPAAEASAPAFGASTVQASVIRDAAHTVHALDFPVPASMAAPALVVLLSYAALCHDDDDRDDDDRDDDDRDDDDRDDDDRDDHEDDCEDDAAAPGVASVTLAGTALTHVASRQDGHGRGVSAWLLTGAPVQSGAGTTPLVRATWSEAVQDSVLVAAIYTGVNANQPLGVSAVASGSGSPSSGTGATCASQPGADPCARVASTRSGTRLITAVTHEKSGHQSGHSVAPLLARYIVDGATQWPMVAPDPPPRLAALGADAESSGSPLDLRWDTEGHRGSWAMVAFELLPAASGSIHVVDDPSGTDPVAAVQLGSQAPTGAHVTSENWVRIDLAQASSVSFRIVEFLGPLGSAAATIPTGDNAYILWSGDGHPHTAAQLAALGTEALRLTPEGTAAKPSVAPGTWYARLQIVQLSLETNQVLAAGTYEGHLQVTVS